MTALVGAALVIAACGSIGFLLAAEKRKSALRTEGFALLIKHISVRLPSLALMDDIMGEFENKALAEAGVLQTLKNGAGTCNKRFAAVAEAQKGDSALYAVLKPLANELGSTDYERQRQSLNDAEAKLTALSEARQAKLEGGERCYRWLGVLAGVLTVILLL